MNLRAALLLLGLLLPALAPAAEPVVISGPTMGTTYHVKLVDASPDEAAAIRTVITETLADIDQRLSTYRADSEISRFNRAAPDEWFPVSPATAEIFIAAKELHRQTNGALDITVGPLVRLWHFGPNAINDTKSAADIKPPTDDKLQAARKLIGDEKLAARLAPPALRKQANGLEIDLSAIGEGYAIDRLAALIAKHGIKNFLIELGGEVRASGNSPSGKPWRVAITRPTDDRAEMQVAIPLVTTSQTDAALSTSGDYQRYFEHNGQRYSHIIDPKTARPITHALASVTVAADNALATDAWDTALLVLGPDRGYDCAVKNNIAALFIVRSGDQFVVRETPAWQERFATAASSSPAAPRTQSP
jgi:thiamine biosynthesis lipoprotein